MRIASRRSRGGVRFKHEPAGAGGEGVEHVLVELEGGDDDDARSLVADGGDLTGGLDAVHVGHLDVHEDHVWSGPTSGVDGFQPCRGLADDLDVVGLAQDHAETSPDEVVIVGEQDPDHLAATPSTGMWAVTRNPPPSRGPASNWPPKIETRSLMPRIPRPPGMAESSLAGPARPPSSRTAIPMWLGP